MTDGSPHTGESIYGKPFRINPEAAPGDLEAKWPEPDLGDAILEDTGRYYCAEHMQLEWRRLWTRTWVLAGFLSDLNRPGDYFKFDLGRESFVVVRGQDGAVRAFFNVCPHRGARIVTRDFGHVSSLVCGFHAWSWNLDGSLRNLTDRETFAPSLVCDSPGLVEVRCDTWGGFVFLNIDGKAQPLESFLGVVADHLASYRFEKMQVISELTVEWRANWKVALDAFQEGYHIQMRHPEGMRYLDYYHCQRDMFPNGHGRLIFPMGVQSPRLPRPAALPVELRELLEDVQLDPDDFEGRLDAIRPAIQKARRTWAERFGLDYDHFTDSQLSDDWNYSLFPNVTLNIHCDNALLMRFRPHPADPERCLYDIIVLAVKVDDPAYRLPRYMNVPEGTDLSGRAERPPRERIDAGASVGLGLVLDQDAEMVPLVQQGMRSQAFKGMRLSYQEVRLRHFYAEYERHLSSAD